ncbi:hypothetical protein ACFOG5_23260 [Pedobacter fastidiosus]|uniref:Outer membrane protein beta-barrel domain-containing protein n=1 Tax=Pedobacter fastidiosus TaxID=2765361 RepID=A0ABR7KTS0_9SPHI|nr:hypothetical protein [Pedobacter fastidiosus]MBC6111513.1 hypothetical protein [Pedobacter fastidiosus]
MDKEIIEHIVAQLNAHEELYSDGAWERFSEPKKKRRPIIAYWPLWGAVALILITAGIFFSLNNAAVKTDFVVNEPTLKAEKPKAQNNSNNQKANSSTQDINNQILTSTSPTEKKFKNNEFIEPEKHSSLSIGNIENLTANQFASVSNTEEITTPNRIYNSLDNHLAGSNLLGESANRNFNIVVEKKKTAPKTSFEQLLAHDSKANELNPIAKTGKDSKWSPGIYVAPAMGNDNKVNMNYGFSLAYNVAGKLSISSGISYTSLSSTSNPSSNTSALMDSPASSQSLSRDSKSLESVDAQLRGINIPLELKYNISNKFYTGIGISALAILNNKQENNYVINQAQNTTVVNSMGYSEQKMLLVTERVSEPQAESVIAPQKYLGFYNFSLGYKQKISPKKNIAIEPFLRLPMKTFSNENLNLTNGGLRLKIDF